MTKINEAEHLYSQYADWGWISDRGRVFEGLKDQYTEDHEEYLQQIIDDSLIPAADAEKFMMADYDEMEDTSYPLSNLAIKMGWIRWLIEKKTSKLFVLGKSDIVINKHLDKLTAKLKGKFKKIEYDTVGVKSYSIVNEVAPVKYFARFKNNK